VINNLLLEINVITFNKVINGYFLFRQLNPYTYVSVKFQIRRSVISKRAIKGTNYRYGLCDETATERGA